jgi:hypothetical protein
VRVSEWRGHSSRDDWSFLQPKYDIPRLHVLPVALGLGLVVQRDETNLLLVSPETDASAKAWLLGGERQGERGREVIICSGQYLKLIKRTRKNRPVTPFVKYQGHS